MKYEVTYSCGHVGAVQIYGTAAGRKKKIEKSTGRMKFLLVLFI